MTNFFQQTSPGVQRLHSQFARELSVHTYLWDESAGSNAYSDGDWTQSTSTVQGTLRKPTEPSQVTDGEGNDVIVDATIFVHPDDVDISLGVGDESRATEFTDPQTGISYEAVSVDNQESLLAIDCVSL
jgi:hypothetical protein